jgi:hypothetical protein
MLALNACILEEGGQEARILEMMLARVPGQVMALDTLKATNP